MAIVIDTAIQKDENARMYNLLSIIVKEEVKGTNLNVFEFAPKELPIFYFYKNFLGKLLLGMDYEPLFVDGRPINPHIIVRDKGFFCLAEKISDEYKKESGIEMRIIQ